MNTQELFLTVVGALVAANVINKMVVNPLINKLNIALFGNPQAVSKNITGGKDSSLVTKPVK